MVSVCENHNQNNTQTSFATGIYVFNVLTDHTRKGLVTGSILTENLPLFCGKPRELQLFKPLVRNTKSPRFCMSTFILNVYM